MRNFHIILLAITLSFLFSFKILAKKKSNIFPNELGKIMVLMYHEIGEKESTWIRTAQNFRKDIQTLYDKGYRPISLLDYVNNNIPTPFGYSPVVITFDDGTKNQFNIIDEEKKTIDPNSAVGILEDFNKKHPDFPLEATFFINNDSPFEQANLIEYKLNYLIEKGMDIGNHSTKHQNLKEAKHQDPFKIQKIIGKQANFLKDKLTRFADYQINTYSLCYGQRPRSANLRRYLKKGVFDGKRYNNIAIVNVGANPSFSPIDKQFNAFSISRIRASQTNTKKHGLYYWIKYLDRNPKKRFISDGDPKTVTTTKRLAKKVFHEKLNKKPLIILDK